MTFLEEAYQRGVLRQVGGSYQFRHAELQEALLAIIPGRPAPAALPDRPPARQGAGTPLRGCSARQR